MEKRRIVGIGELINKENMYTVIYDVTGIYKEAIYPIDSDELLKCINTYMNLLHKKEKLLDDKRDTEIFKKKICNNTLIIIFALLVIYFIMSMAIHGNYLLGIVGYILSLMIIIMSFIFAAGLAYKNKKDLLQEIDRNNIEILKIENIKERISKLKKTK